MRVLKNVTLNGQITDITVNDGKIVEIGKTEREGVDFSGLDIYPGLIDIHLHGCLGYDTMDREDGLSEMAKFLLSRGTTSFCPTTMTMPREDIVRATSRDITTENGANILGFHLEGPFIAAACRGAQNAEHILPPDIELILKTANAVRITLAPEVEGAMEIIPRLCELGVQVSLGHSEMDYETASAAFEAGASSLTHTFNAMRGIHHRNPGPILALADRKDGFAEVIADLLHIHPAVLRMLVRVLGEDRVILVSDSMRAAGLGDGVSSLGGQTVFVKDGRATLKDGSLAGSVATLLDCVKNMIKIGFDKRSAVKMASENPARMLGLNKGKIEVGFDADFILVDKDFNLKYSIARGEF